MSVSVSVSAPWNASFTQQTLRLSRTTHGSQRLVGGVEFLGGLRELCLRGAEVRLDLIDALL